MARALQDDPLINTTVSLRLSTRDVLRRRAVETGQPFTAIMREACEEFAIRLLEAEQATRGGQNQATA